MPEITNDTPRSQVTIAEKTFSVPQPYAAGHVLNANEASALNQTYAENVRNNKAKAVKEAVAENKFDQDVFQGQIDDYCSSYEFGVRTGGGRTGDPVMAEAMDITRDLVRKTLAKQIAAGTCVDAEGARVTKLSDISAARISELAKGVLNRNDANSAKIMATARQRVEEANEIDDVQLDSLGAGEPSTEGKKSKKEPVPAS